MHAWGKQPTIKECIIDLCHGATINHASWISHHGVYEKIARNEDLIHIIKTLIGEKMVENIKLPKQYRNHYNQWCAHTIVISLQFYLCQYYTYIFRGEEYETSDEYIERCGALECKRIKCTEQQVIKEMMKNASDLNAKNMAEGKLCT